MQPTGKEAERAAVKAERRARHIPPTVEAYECVAASGPTRLTATLISRHSTRIENLDAVAQLSMDHCLPRLLSACELDAVFIRQGHELTQHAMPHESPWPTHLSWSVQSTIAALRLMLAGQIVGAAIILRQQLGRWTLLLARADAVVWRRHEPIESFVARAWTERAMDKLGLHSADVGAGDIFDDLDDHPRTMGVIDTAHEHVRIDGRALCPAHVYHALCKLIDGQQPDQGVECEVVDDLDAEHTPMDTSGPADILSDTLALCMIQMELATVATYVLSRDPETMRGIPIVSAPKRRLTQQTSEVQLPLSKPQVTQLTSVLVPLVDSELATFTTIDDLWRLYTDYHTALANRYTAQRWTPRELAELAFAAHRFSRLLITADAHAQDRKILDGRLKIHQHLTHASPYVLTAEFAALCALWNQSRPEIAAAATQISSALLSGYWLWLEEDDRAMGILRCTLHQAARLRTWHVHADAAQALQSTSWATPRRWMSIAGWSKFRSLDRALFEFAHANRESRLDAAGILLDDDHDDPESPLSQRVARQTALDRVTALAAAETVRVVAAHQSPAIADTMREALRQRGLDIQTNPGRRQPNKRTSPHRTAQDTTASPDIPLID
ncbi:hypothetical protein [Mycobacterium intracellulare]|uniref:hypothetical protein n=1 Tax=Mycobacterium intracellulare TaxID=1767 RepID=UPI0011553073|nr:hypothetical protein [Mycobacterium intracellulare]